MNRIRRLSEESEKKAIMESSKSKGIRIVNLAKDTKYYELTAFLKEQLNLQGEIKEIYIRNDYRLGLVFAYVIFEYSCDAKTAVEKLNLAFYKSLLLDVTQIAPNGIYKKYACRSLEEKLAELRQQVSRHGRIYNARLQERLFSKCRAGDSSIIGKPQSVEGGLQPQIIDENPVAD